jgi:NAD(P)-dependent dehydrogenase (short-subunit alcohol dehydrogenase family)
VYGCINCQELKSQVTGSGEIFPIQCDLAQEADAMKMFDAIKQKWGGVDICVNNAGLSIGGRLCGKPLLSSGTVNYHPALQTSKLGPLNFSLLGKSSGS